MVKLKNFVDFAYTLVNMDEVQKNTFPVPKEITYILDESTHENIEKEVLEQKGITKEDIVGLTNFDEFDVEIFDINFKFVKNG